MLASNDTSTNKSQVNHAIYCEEIQISEKSNYILALGLEIIKYVGDELFI